MFRNMVFDLLVRQSDVTCSGTVFFNGFGAKVTVPEQKSYRSGTKILPFRNSWFRAIGGGWPEVRNDLGKALRERSDRPAAPPAGLGRSRTIPRVHRGAWPSVTIL